MSTEEPSQPQDHPLQFRLFTQHHWLLCRTQTTHSRLVDLLNANADRMLPVQVAASGSLAGNYATTQTEPVGTASVNTAAVLFGVPIETEDAAPRMRSPRWVERSSWRVTIGLGSCEVVGNIHVPIRVGRGTWDLSVLEAFFVVTKPTIRFGDGSPFLENVIVVNRAEIEYICP